MPLLALHPEARIVRLQLRQNLVLKHLDAAQWRELEPLLEIVDYPKGAALEHQGDWSMEQYFIIDGILKRVVSNAQGREMILRFAAETDIDTSYAAWRLKTPIPYSIRAVTKVRAAKLSMQQWVAFPRAPPRGQERVRVRDHEADERGHGPYHHAPSARRAGTGAALHAQAYRARRIGCPRRISPPTSTSRPKRCRGLKRRGKI